MTLEEEKRYLLLLASYFLISKGITPSKAEVLNSIEKNGWVILTHADIQCKKNRNELVWRNDFAFVRKHLTDFGFYQNQQRNNWSITPTGQKELYRLHQKAKFLSHVKISPAAIQYAETIVSFL